MSNVLPSLIPHGRAALGAVLWRHRGQLSVTTVVEATFPLVSAPPRSLA